MEHEGYEDIKAGLRTPEQYAALERELAETRIRLDEQRRTVRDIARGEDTRAAVNLAPRLRRVK